MRKALWVLAWIGIGVWTLMSIGAYVFVDLFGDAAKGITGHVPGFPVEMFSGPWFAQLGRSIGFVAVLFAWLVGVLAILSVPVIASFFLRKRRRGDDDDREERRRRRDDDFRADVRSVRVPGLGRVAGPFGRLPERLEKNDFARKLFKKLR